MRGAVVPVLVGVFFLGACGGHDDDAADTGAASAREPRGEPIVIHTTMFIAATAGSEPIATGKVIEGSTLAGSPFCTGGTIRDAHGSTDPTVPLIARTITCSDGTVKIDFTPEPPQGLTQKGRGGSLAAPEHSRGYAATGT